MFRAGTKRAAASIGSAPHVARIERTSSLRPTYFSRKRGPIRHFSGAQERPSSPSPPPPPPESWPRQSVFLRLLNRYTSLLEIRPLTTKATTSGIIGNRPSDRLDLTRDVRRIHLLQAGAGDFTCQLLGITLSLEVDMDEETYVDMDQDVPPRQVLSVISDVDWSRCARFAAIGAGFLAPSLHYWYGFLGRRFPGLSVTAVAKRVALDQLVFTPVFVAAFLSLAMLIDGQAAKIGAKLRAEYMTTVVSNWGYWIPAQVINFRFVAQSYQVLYSNALGFIWNVYLSFQANKAITEESGAQATTSDFDGDDGGDGDGNDIGNGKHREA